MENIAEHIVIDKLKQGDEETFIALHGFLYTG